MLLRIISAEWELYNSHVDKVILPTDDGYLGIFPGHINLVSPLSSGFVRYIPSEQPTSVLDSFADHHHTISISWWLMMIEDDIVTIAAE
jgi:F0F1-type ATP synthase epsilon subunit